MTFNTVVLIDDDSAHRTLIERNLRRAEFDEDVLHFGTGQQAIDWLQHLPASSDISPFVLLDINIPETSGIDVLATLKNSNRTHDIPVVMLTTSDNPQEIEQCYELGCNAYITKPVAQNEFQEVIQKLGRFIMVLASTQRH